MSLKKSFKGWLGEVVTSAVMKFTLDPKVYRKINNLTLTVSDGVTQVDHVIVSQYGIFVVETKNMSGWIFGSESNPRWTQLLAGKKYPFQNPLFQNHRHIKALQEITDLPFEVFHSVISFVPGECTFKTEMPKNVLNTGLIPYIESFSTKILTEDQVDKAFTLITNSLLEKNIIGLSTNETKQTHMASLIEKHESDNCPRCGSKLLLRKSKKEGATEFYGCSTYPKCRYNRKL